MSTGRGRCQGAVRERGNEAWTGAGPVGEGPGPRVGGASSPRHSDDGARNEFCPALRRSFSPLVAKALVHFTFQAFFPLTKPMCNTVIRSAGEAPPGEDMPFTCPSLRSFLQETLTEHLLYASFYFGSWGANNE